MEAVDFARKYSVDGYRSGWKLPSIRDVLEGYAYCVNDDEEIVERERPRFSFEKKIIYCENNMYARTRFGFISSFWVEDFSFAYDKDVYEKFSRDVISSDESTEAKFGQRLEYCMIIEPSGGYRDTGLKVHVRDCLSMLRKMGGGDGYDLILVNDSNALDWYRNVEPVIKSLERFQLNYLARQKDKYQKERAVVLREDEVRRKEKAEGIKKLKAFQKNIRVGDRAFNGLILDIKGDIVQMQLTCAKVSVFGTCERHANGEIRWLRRDEIFPR